MANMLSVTMLSECMYCPRKLYLQYVLGLAEPPKECLVLGSLKHKVFEEINNSEQRIVSSINEKISLSDMKSLYKSEYFRILKEVIEKKKKDLDQFSIPLSDAFKRMMNSVFEEAEQRAENVFNFIESNAVFGEELWEKLTPKILSEIRVESKDLLLKGVIDRIEVYGDSFVPIELKTGKSPREGAWPGHKLQLSAYMVVLEQDGKHIDHGRIVYLDSKSVVKVVINPFIEEDVKKHVDHVNLVLSSRQAPPFVDNMNKCASCGLKDRCYDKAFIEKRLSEVLKTA